MIKQGLPKSNLTFEALVLRLFRYLYTGEGFFLCIKHSVLIDTSCGSGGFLLHALDKVRKAATDKYPNYKADIKQYQRWWPYWHNFAESNLFGIEINEQIARTAKMNMIIHDDGHTNVVASDGLVPPEVLQEKTGNSGFRRNSFEFIITNPPFGSVIKQTEKAYLHQYSLATKEVDWLNPASKVADRPSQSSEVLFIEQAEQYLAQGGYLAIVLPDGILTNSSMQYVRDYISDTFRVVAVVSMPQTAFMATGAGVKSSVLFLKKHSKKEKEKRQALRTKIQSSLLSESDYGIKLISLIEQKKKEGTKYNKLIKAAELNAGNAVQKLKNERQSIIDNFDEKIEKIRELLLESYEEQYKKSLVNYPILMATAEDIGFDATGKETGNNELIEISKELSRFIEAIENGKDRFFSKPQF